MKKIIVVIFMMGFMGMSKGEAAQGPLHKIYRGAANIVTAPIEIPKQARAYWIKGAQITPHILVWIGSGAVWGVVQGIKRLGSGVWDVISFPFAVPLQFEPLLKPHYVFEQWPINPRSGR